ncbi:MAG TPA: polyhydroxyalkanoic acid system family protein [Candidatus Paceibacterota bacterium]
MHIQIPHKFFRPEALSRVKNAIVEAKTQMGDKGTIDEERWEGNTLHFAVSGQGQKISGTLEVKDKEFILDAKLPLMLRLFEGKIEKAIKEQASQMLK